PSTHDVAILKQWIEAGTPEAGSAPPPRRTLSERDIIPYISEDLEGTAEDDPRFVRYFTICHLAKLGLSEDQVPNYRNGLSKLVNSLSWGKKIVIPKPIDPGKTILRIDLRDYKWNTTVWTRITGMYRYTVFLRDATATAVYAALDWDVPHIRADWFVYQASRPPLYHLALKL